MSDTPTARAPERYALWVCRDCAQPAHGPGDRCPRDRRRTWTQMAEVDYVRADLHEGTVALLREVARCGVSFEDPRLSFVEVQIDRRMWDAVAAYDTAPAAALPND